MEKYQPISCDFYDVLEATAVRRIRSRLVYRDEDDMEVCLEDVKIEDLRTRNKQEFMLLDNGQEIRLDRLVSLNDQPAGDHCIFPVPKD